MTPIRLKVKFSRTEINVFHKKYLNFIIRPRFFSIWAIYQGKYRFFCFLLQSRNLTSQWYASLLLKKICYEISEIASSLCPCSIRTHFRRIKLFFFTFYDFLACNFFAKNQTPGPRHRMWLSCIDFDKNDISHGYTRINWLQYTYNLGNKFGLDISKNFDWN